MKDVDSENVRYSYGKTLLFRCNLVSDLLPPDKDIINRDVSFIKTEVVQGLKGTTVEVSMKKKRRELVGR